MRRERGPSGLFPYLEGRPYQAFPLPSSGQQTSPGFLLVQHPDSLISESLCLARAEAALGHAFAMVLPVESSKRSFFGSETKFHTWFL